MTPPVVLLTDFGLADPYVGIMKAVLLSRRPQLAIVDLCHEIPPQGVRHAVFVLAQAIPYLPAPSIVVAVVDPGVGTSRRVLCALAAGRVYLAPDNGILGAVPRETVEAVHEVSDRSLFLEPLSRTFHGRDVFAPVAAALAAGHDPRRLGPRVESYARTELPLPRMVDGGWRGEVLSVDRFGNLITNLPGPAVRALGARVEVDFGADRGIRLVETYAEGTPGHLVALIGSSGTVEIAVPGGSAARLTGAAVGDAVEARAPSPAP